VSTDSREAAIVTVGSELTLGLRLDTNTRDIASALTRTGHTVVETVTVGDDSQTLSESLRRLCESYPLVIVTGGLGPTHDDITRESAAQALGLELVPDEKMARWLRRIAERHKDPAAAAQVFRQADVLEGAEVFRPTSGTAPGQRIPTDRGALVLLPGPPHEMLPMLETALGQLGPDTSETLRCVGISESDAQVRAERVLEAHPSVSLTVLATPSLVDVVLVRGDGGDLAPATAAVEAELDGHVYARGGVSLAEAVLDRARKAGATIAVAESCTGGMIAAALTDVPGSSAVLLGGVVAYGNDAKVSLLGVDPCTIADDGAVSTRTAEEMAAGAASTFGATLAVSVTGIAGPDGGTDEKPVGTVCFGIAQTDHVTSFTRALPGDRSRIRTRATVAALEALRTALER
jgi:nicotinamide-nucleotide amidase